MEQGGHVIVRFDSVDPYPLWITFDECAEAPMAPEEMRQIAALVENGSLVIVLAPTIEEFLRCVETESAKLEAEIERRRGGIHADG